VSGIEYRGLKMNAALQSRRLYPAMAFDSAGYDVSNAQRVINDIPNDLNASRHLIEITVHRKAVMYRPRSRLALAAYT